MTFAMDFAEAVEQKLHSAGQNYDFAVIRGRKYDKIVMTRSGSDQRSIYAFVNKTTGELIKAATWDQPAKNKNGDTFGKYFLDTPTGFATALHNADAYGSFLYSDFRVEALQK